MERKQSPFSEQKTKSAAPRTHKQKKTAAEAKAKYDAKSFSKLRELKADDYKIVRFLGYGGRGAADLASVKNSNQLVVIKEIRSDRQAGKLDKFRAELSILHRLKRLCRKGLVPCYVGYFWNPKRKMARHDENEPDPHDHDDYLDWGSWCFVTNYMGEDAITMFSFLKSKPGEGMAIAERWRRFKSITANLVKGMKQLHDLDVTHSDAHSENILIHTKNLKITFIDFGEACYKGFCLEPIHNIDYDRRRSYDWREIMNTVIDLIKSLELQTIDLAVINRYLHSFDLDDFQLSVTRRAASPRSYPTEPFYLRARVLHIRT